MSLADKIGTRVASRHWKRPSRTSVQACVTSAEEAIEHFGKDSWSCDYDQYIAHGERCNAAGYNNAAVAAFDWVKNRFGQEVADELFESLTGEEDE